jgi:hypothetical protein
MERCTRCKFSRNKTKVDQLSVPTRQYASTDVSSGSFVFVTQFTPAKGVESVFDDFHETCAEVEGR